MIKSLADIDSFEIAIQTKVLVVFYANWCGKCKSLDPLLEKMNHIDILKIDVERFPTLAKKYGIISIPTLILFNDSHEEKKIVGLKTQKEIDQMLL